ncbi:outer membrane protein [Bartonella bovis]|uniref:Hemin binding protein n=1 Tax=Bartonella bovis 91-4 TaxID=1094491 RepID=N6VGW6_9HYPH|nr:outer membrane protein [Bartonella bovis]ENN92486.1 hemin binding protein [Bartonella bovis 91-4]
MNTKCLITASILTLVTSSVVQAENSTISQESTSVSLSNVAPTFSWTGFYFGGQIGGFSSKTSLNLNYFKGINSKKLSSIEKDLLPKLSGFIGGLYAGANFDLNNSLVLGVDTDIIWSDKKDTKVIKRSAYRMQDGPKLQRENNKVEAVDIKHLLEKFTVTYSHTLKQKWAGATRVRIGFAADRIMPYIAGGVAYTQLQDIFLASIEAKEDKVVDETKAMIGYTFGGGIDFAMTDDFILRAEYRFSNFGKKKFVKDKFEIDYKTNDFRVGVSYKF